MRGYLWAALPEETTVLVTLDNSKKCIYGLDFKVGLIAMPFQITLHSENLPEVLAAHECRPGNRQFGLLRRVVVHRSDFKDLDALAINLASKVYLVTDVMWRTATFQE